MAVPPESRAGRERRTDRPPRVEDLASRIEELEARIRQLEAVKGSNKEIEVDERL